MFAFSATLAVLFFLAIVCMSQEPPMDAENQKDRRAVARAIAEGAKLAIDKYLLENPEL